MIKLFGTTDTIYTTNGDIILQPIKAKVKCEDNGAYYLDLEAGLEYVNDITEGRIIAADTPDGTQAFRVGNVQKKNSKLTSRCYHVFYDTRNYLIVDSYVRNKGGNAALDQLNTAAVGGAGSPFTTLSDVSKVNTYRCVRKSLYEAINTLVERWGGHLVRNNWTIELRTTIGADNGVTVRYAKNIQEITSEENWDGVVTKLLPVGRDGILLNAVDPSASLYVESEQQYDRPYCKTVTFSQSIDRTEGESDTDYLTRCVADLQYQAQNYVDQYCFPQVNYQVKVNLETITGLGDTVEVIDERLGLNLMTNVISYEYDCILEKYTNIELGNFRQTITGLFDKITSSVENTVNHEIVTATAAMNEELQRATAEILAHFENSYVIYKGNEILVVDRLPAEPHAGNVMRINSGGIGFSTTGTEGTFSSAWLLDGTFDAQQINVLNFTADLIHGNTLKLGGAFYPTPGEIRLYDADGNLIGIIGQGGVKMLGGTGETDTGRPYVLMNNVVGFAGFDENDTKMFWADRDEFHMKKTMAEEELTICESMRFIKIDFTDSGNVAHKGIGLVSAE